MLAIVSAN